MAPLGYHLVNLLLHTGVVLLLWRLLRRLEVPGAWFAAAVFAVHPLHVESVAWVIGRKDVLATVFYLSSMLAYIRCTEMPRGRRRGGPYLLAVALFVLGLLSKSIAITLPAALLLWHWWRHGRVTLADGSRTAAVLPGRAGHRAGRLCLFHQPRTRRIRVYAAGARAACGARAWHFTSANCCGRWG